MPMWRKMLNPKSSAQRGHRSRFVLFVVVSSPSLDFHVESLSQNAVRDVLVAIVQLGGERVQRVLYQLLDLALQLLLGQVHVEAIAQIAHRTGATVLEARQL